MNKKWVWYVCAVLLCCGSLAFISIAKQSDNNRNATLLNSLAKQKASLIQNGNEAEYQAKLDALTGKATVGHPTKVGQGAVDENLSTSQATEQVAAPATVVADDVKATYEQLKSMIREGVQLTPDQKDVYNELEETYFTPRSSADQLDDTGGPSAFGYYWKDNLNGDTTVYAWEEPTTPTELTTLASSDDGFEICNFGFNFSFYGTTYTSGYVTTNGYIGFGTGSGDWSNDCPRAVGTPSTPAILPFWDDGHASYGASSDGGRVVYQTYADHVTITWDSMGTCCTANTDRLDYQVQLWNNGKIKFQYRQIQALTGTGTNGRSPLIGIQQSATLDYLNYHCSTAMDSAYTNALDGRAIWFYLSTATTGRCCYGNVCAPTCVDGVNATDCATLGGTFAVDLNCTSNPCPTPAAGDLVCNAIPVTALPFSAAGNTCAFANNYDEVCPFGGSTAADVVYVYSPGANTVVDINLCGGTTAYDTKLYVYENTVTPGAPFACNDDACANPPLYNSSFISQLLALSLTGGNTYYIVVDGYSTSCGDYTLSISVPTLGSCCYGENLCCIETSESACATLGGVYTAGGTCAANPCVQTCTVSCGAFDVLEIAESDTTGFETADPNGGCNTTVPGASFQNITCGDTVCGRSFFYGNGAWRDTDWFRFTITDTQNVSFGGISEFNGFFVGIVAAVDPCNGPYFVSTAGGFEVACGTAYTGSINCLAPGTYALFVSMSAGEFTCPTLAADANYRAWVSCTPCTPPTGNCCYYADPNELCADGLTLADCNALGGSWVQGGTCALNPCTIARCCYDAGTSCGDFTLEHCNALGGTWTFGSSCAVNPCPVPPANDDCGTAAPLVLVPNGSVAAAVNNEGANATCTDTCDFTSIGPDQFFTITLNTCRLIAVTASDPAGLTFPDAHVSVYNDGDCCGNAILCNDDWGNFDVTGLTWLNPAIYPPYSLSSMVADSLGPGTYSIRAGYYGSSWGIPYTLTVYDFGPCVIEPCDPIVDLAITVESVGNLPNNYKLFWTAPQSDDYKVWSSTNPQNDGNPDDGADANFVLEATLLGLTAGPQTWTAPAGFVAYKNFVVTTVCEPYTAPTGRCCYDNNTQCSNITQAECDALTGDWNAFETCESAACPPPLPSGRCCYDGGASCVDNLEAECTLLVGVWTEGVTCAGNPCGVAPANDECGSAIEVFNATPVSGTNIDATGTDISSCVFTDPYDVWYFFVAATTDPVWVTMCDAGTNYDTGLAIYDACGGAELACNDDDFITPPDFFCSVNGVASTLEFTPPAAGTYYIRVSGYNSSTGNFVLTVTQ